MDTFLPTANCQQQIADGGKLTAELDVRNIYDLAKVVDRGFYYEGIGRNG